MNLAFRHAPAHWRSMRLKHTVQACTNGIWGEEPRGGPEDVICVRVTDFDRSRLRVTANDPTLRFIPATHRNGRMLSRGDLLLEKSGGGDGQPVGAVVMYDSDRPAVSSNFIARMPVAQGFDARYLCYLHAALYRLGVNCRSIRQTTGIQNLDSKVYLDELVRVPDFAEQRRIAEFLDRKTCVLDGLLRNKQQLLGLLRERRDTLVSQILTSHKNAPVTRFKFIRSGALLYGANEPAGGCDRDGPRYIRITDLSDDGTLREHTFQSLPGRLAAPYLLRDGDLLLARSGATAGKAFRYREEWGPACFASYLVRLRPDRRKILPDYLYYYTRSAGYRNQVRLNTVQSTIANVSAERFGNFSIPLPSLAEQQAMVELLQRATGTLERLMATIERQLGRLQEYRCSLIVAAVTGEGQEQRSAVPSLRR